MWWKNQEPSTCCEKVIIKEDNWIFVAETNEARIALQVVSCGKHLWEFGGMGHCQTSLNTTEYYDDVTDKWTKSNSTIEKRRGHRAVAFRQEVYVIGGDGGHALLSSAEKLDTTTGQWTALRSMAVGRFSFGAAITEHKLYCFGGTIGGECGIF